MHFNFLTAIPYGKTFSMQTTIEKHSVESVDSLNIFVQLLFITNRLCTSGFFLLTGQRGTDY